MNTPSQADEFGTEVTAFVDAFVDAFVSGATSEKIDKFLEEGSANFYNTVTSDGIFFYECAHQEN